MNDTIDLEATIAHADRDFPALFQLFGGYFHQDWRDEHETPDDAVQAFISEAPPDAVAAAAAELDRLLDGSLDDAAILRLIEEGFASEFVPSIDGATTTDWLPHVRDMLRHAGSSSR